MNWFEVAEEARPSLLKNDYAKCEETVARALRACPSSRFHETLKADFTNDPAAVAHAFTAFFEKESKKFEVKAIYTETNGFDINPKRWFFDLFAYEGEGGLDDLDWLSDWQSGDWPNTTLTGMEPIQEVYKSEKLGSDSAYLSSLLIVVKFQKLIFKAKPLMKIGSVPIYSTAHEYDFVAKC